MIDRRAALVVVMSGGIPVSFSDSFARADGAIGNGWIGSTWNIVSNAAVNTPGMSDELLVDPGFEQWTSPSNLTQYSENPTGLSTINQETTVVHGGSNALRLDIDASNSLAQVYKSITALAQYDWLLLSTYVQCATGSDQFYFLNGVGSTVPRTAATSYGQLLRTLWLPTTNKSIGVQRGSGAASKSIYIDDLSCKTITKSTLFAVRKAAKNYSIKAKITTLPGINVGLVGSVDDPSNPLNHIIVMVDAAGGGGTGTINVYANKTVAGVTSSIQADGAGTYSAGAELRLIKYDTTIHVYYNYIKIGTYTVPDATVVDNEYLGLFSSYNNPSCKITDFVYDKVNYMTNVYEIGDSKTVGNNGGAGPAADGDATDLLSGHNVFVQSPAKFALNGWDAADLASGIDAALAAASTTPEFCFINIGYNDAGETPTAEGDWKASIQYVIDALNTKWSSLKIYLDKGWSSDRTANMAVINGWIDDLVALNAAKNVYVGLDETIWMEAGDNGATYTVDGVHPNAAGYTLRASLRKQLVGYSA